MVCQTLWNYSGKITSTNAFFGEQEAQELTEILIDFLGKQKRIKEMKVYLFFFLKKTLFCFFVKITNTTKKEITFIMLNNKYL